MATVFDVLARFRADVTDYTKNLGQAERATDKFSGNVNSGVSRAGGMFQGLIGTVSKVGVAVVGLAQTAGMMGIRTAMANEQAAIGFKVMLGSAEKAKEFMDELIAFSAKTPFELPQLRTAASALLSTGVAAEKVIPIMEALGDATAAKGYGADAIQRAVYALQQMSTAGRATGQDMMQLTQAGVPIWEALAASMGKTIPEIKQLGEQGKLSADQVMQAIQTYSGEGMQKVKGMMIEQSGTLTGLLSTLKDTVGQSLGSMMEPAVASIKKALPEVTTMVDQVLKSIGPTVNEVVGTTLGALTDLLPAVTPVIIGFGSIFTSIMKAVAPFIPMLAESLIALTPVFETIAFAVTDLGNSLLPVAQEIFPILLGVVTQATELFSSLVHWLIENKNIVLTVIAVYATFRATLMAVMVVQKLIAFFRLLTSAEAMATAQTWLFNSALYANPIGLIIAAIAALVVAVVLLYKKFEWFRDGIATVWNFIVDAIEFAVNAILGYYEFMINMLIKGVNLLIKAWNLIPFHDDVDTLKEINLELDLAGWKIDTAADNANRLNDNLNRAKLTTSQMSAYAEYYASRVAAATAGLDPTNKPKETTAPPTGGGGGGSKTSQRLQELRNQIKATYETAIQRARQNLQSLQAEQDRFGESIQSVMRDNIDLANSFSKVADAQAQQNERLTDIANTVRSAVVGVVQFNQILDRQRGAQEALTQAQSRQAEVQQAVAERQEVVNALVDRYNKALPGRGQAQIYSALEEAVADLASAQEALAQSTKAVESAQQDATNAGQGFVDGFRKQVEAARKFSEQIVNLRNLGLNETLIRQVASAGAIAGGAIAEELIAGGASVIAEANDLQTSLETIASTAGTSVANSFQQTGTDVATQLLNAMQSEAEKATAFADKIKELVKLGLSYENIQQVIGAGRDAGTSIADALIAGGKDTIDKANAIQESLKTAASSAATAVSGSYFSAGVTLAEALVAGIESAWSAVGSSIEAMKESGLAAAQAVATAITDAYNAVNIGTPSAPNGTYTMPANVAALTGLASLPAGFGRTGGGGGGAGAGGGTSGTMTASQAEQKFLEQINAQYRAFGTTFTSLYQYLNSTASYLGAVGARRDRWNKFAKAAGVPGFAQGGIVMSPTLGLIGEGGQPEAIIPLTRLENMIGGRSAGDVIQVTVNVSGSVISERDLIEQVRVGLLRAQKSGRQVVLA